MGCQAGSSGPEFQSEVASIRQHWVPSDPSMPTLAFDREEAQSSKTTYVFLHGWCENRQFWGPLVTALQLHEPTAMVLTVDLPGHGESQDWLQAGSPREMAHVLRAWISDQGLGPVVLVGHNYGATVALETARSLQEASGDAVRGVIALHALYDPSQAYGEDTFEPFAKALEANFHREMTSFSTGLMTEDSEPESRAWVSEQMGQARPEQAVALLRALSGFDLRPTLRELRMPVRAINGSMPPTNLEAGQAFLADFEATVIPDLPGAGFAPMVQAPEACALAILAYSADWSPQVSAIAEPEGSQTP